MILISDDESWTNPGTHWSTQTLQAWDLFKRRIRNARMVCLDIQPYGTVQAPPDRDILHVGGFSDRVFDVIRSFLEASGDANHWVREIERVASSR